jgi:subtilisin family serine protease
MRKLLVGLVAGALILTAAPAQAATTAPWGMVRGHVDRAWSTTHGSSRVIVAVVDTGVSRVPGLAGRILPGHDFVNDDNDATDDNGHGTMAAGVIAAAGANGICWTCRILPVKVLGPKGAGSYTDIALGIRYAADQHATIISLSLGGAEDSRLLRDAVAYAVGKGALVIAAAGNRGTTTPHYPAAIPAVLAVGGITATGARYSWSNYGSWVDITAPGCNPAQGRDGVVAQFCGTSSATPFVAGVAALLASTAGAPGAQAIRAALTSSAQIDAVAALRYLADTTAPAVRVFADSRFAPTVHLTARATDASGIDRMELLVNGHLVTRVAGGLHRFAIRTAGYGRTVTARVRVYDRAGHVRLSPVRSWVRPGR